MLSAALIGAAFGIVIPAVAAVAYVVLDAVVRACKSDGTRTIVLGLLWAAGCFLFGTATVASWEMALADHRRSVRRRRLFKSVN
jgi:hypothetical protein